MHCWVVGVLAGALALHRCDNPSCIRRSHLTPMVAATENHAAEWLGPDGKLCAAKITPELRAKYDALPTTTMRERRRPPSA